MLILLINSFAGTCIYSKALSGYNSIKQNVSIETAVTYLYTVRLDEMGKNNIKMDWIPTRDMAFSSKGKAARFRIQSAVANPGEGPPLIFWPTEARRAQKKKIKTTPHPPPFPLIWRSGSASGLYGKMYVPLPCMDVPLYLTFIILLNIMVVWQTVSCLSFLLGTQLL